MTKTKRSITGQDLIDFCKRHKISPKDAQHSLSITATEWRNYTSKDAKNTPVTNETALMMYQFYDARPVELKKGPVFDIPDDRAVIGIDLARFRLTYALTVDETRNIFGLATKIWYDITSKHPNDPVANRSLALLVRFYSVYPQLIPLPPVVSVKELVDAAKDAGIPGSTLSLYMGRERASMHRWDVRGQALSPTTQRLAHHFLTMIAEGRLDEYVEKLVTVEAEALGIEDIAGAGTWTTEKKK